MINLEIENLRLNSQKIVDSYIDKSDWRHSENANQTYSLSGLLFHCAQTVMAHYALRHIYPKDIAELHVNGDIHLHDLGMSNTNYCVGHNLRTLLFEGLGGTHANSHPARHFSSALLQIVNYLGMAQHEHAGAQAFSSIDTYLSPFISYDNLDKKEIKQKLQEFLFNLNIPSRWGQQLLFSNLSLDWLPAPDLKNEYVVFEGKLQTDKYSDFLKEQQLFNRVLMELFYEGDKYGKPFSVTGDTRIPYFENESIRIKSIKELYDDIDEPDSGIKNLNLKIFGVDSNYKTNIILGRKIVKHQNDENILKIKTDRNKIVRISKEHSLFTIVDNHKVVPVQGKNLRIGDVIVAIKKVHLNGEEHFVNYNKRFRHSIKGKRGANWKKETEIVKVDYELAWLLGYFIGDGWRDKRKYHMSLSPANAEETNKVISIVKDIFKTDPVKIKEHEVIYSNIALSEIFDMCYGKKFKKIPDMIWVSSDKIREAFWNGLYDADRHKNQNLFKHANDELLKEMQILALSIGITTSYNEYQKGKNERNYLVIGRDYRFKNWYQKSSSSRIESPSFKKNLRLHPKGLTKFVKSDLTVNVITEIVSEETDDYLYDITAEGNFVGDNGILFHNSFPIPTINITKDFPWDTEETDLLMQLTSKYGIPYFQNFVGSNLNPNDVRSMCCHLRLDMAELRQKTGALFGSGENTGSIGVVDINLNRIGYLAKNDDEYFERLDFLLEKCKRALEIKRKVVTQSLENDLLPLTKKYIGSFDTFFSTISLVGMNESMLNFMNKIMGDKEGIDFTLKVMDFIRKRLIEFQEGTGNLYNLEAAPAESSAFRLAKKDIELYPKIRMYNLEHNAEVPMLTNSTQLPVDYTDDIFEAMDLQDEIQTKYTGGTVFHIFSGESLSNIESLKSLIQKVCNQYKMPYFTFTPTFSICPSHGYLVGEHYTCPICNGKTEVYSRVVGYLRPVSQFNKGKQAEFGDRKNYKI